MGLKRDYFRHSKRVTNSKRWPALRMQALRRDGFQCVKCGARGRLEVDHIKPVRTNPELSFELTNLQCLCAKCHSAKTRREVGLSEPNPKRDAWRDLVATMQREPNSYGV